MPRVLLIERQMVRFLRKPVSVRSAATVIVSTTAVIVVASGLLMRVLDHREYPNIFIGMWWAIQTVTTVGYGDVTPKSIAGRDRCGGGHARRDRLRRDRDGRGHLDLRRPRHAYAGDCRRRRWRGRRPRRVDRVEPRRAQSAPRPRRDAAPQPHNEADQLGRTSTRSCLRSTDRARPATRMVNFQRAFRVGAILVRCGTGLPTSRR